MNSLKEEDSELRFMGNNFLTALRGQSTHEDLVKKSGLRHILFDKSFLRRILLHKQSGLQRILFIKILVLIIQGCMSFQVPYSVYQFISSENDLNSKLSDHNETICTKQ